MKTIRTTIILPLVLPLLLGALLAAAAPQSPHDELPLPDLPATLREPRARANYLLDHFWDALDFADTLRARNSLLVEQAFANYISVFPHADDAARRASVRKLLRRAEADSAAYILLTEIAETYLYEPESPMMSEDYYILFLENMVSSPVLGKYGVLRPRRQLDAARKNRPGMTAADFSYTTPDGQRTTLHDTPVEGPLLLIFYDPDCDHCREVMRTLEKELPTEGVTVLAIHSGDNYVLWRETVRLLPAGWLAGYESGAMQQAGRYVLRSMPTLYLLDNLKRVVLKDARPGQVAETLQR